MHVNIEFPWFERISSRTWLIFCFVRLNFWIWAKGLAWISKRYCPDANCSLFLLQLPALPISHPYVKQSKQSHRCVGVNKDCSKVLTHIWKSLMALEPASCETWGETCSKTKSSASTARERRNSTNPVVPLIAQHLPNDACGSIHAPRDPSFSWWTSKRWSKNQKGKGEKKRFQPAR